MRRPEWIKDASELVECLIKVREVGVWDMRLRRLAIEPLEDLARTICPIELHHDQHRLISRVLELAIPRISRTDFQNAAYILFDLNVESRIPSPKERRMKAAKALYQGYSTFRSPDDGDEKKLLQSVADEIQSLATERKTTSTMDPISWYRQVGVLPEDIMIARNLFHVARTLETRKRYASTIAVKEIEDVLKRYANWHQSRDENGYTLLVSFDAVCLKYIGLSVFELLGKLESRSPGPEYAPHRIIHGLNYPTQQSLLLVPGGTDAFTGEEVTALYMSTFPVTMAEWSDFLAKFGWHVSPYWKRLILDRTDFGLDGVGRYPAVAMTYWDCLAFCFWLWLTTPYRFRLPTEAEWSFAATGGVRQHYPWGNQFEQGRANVARPTGGGGLSTVDGFPPSGRFGLVGQSGNIWEYTSTLWLGEAPQADSDIDIPDLMISMVTPHWWQSDTRVAVGRDNYLQDTKIVMKGGSWSLGSEYATVGTRIYSSLFNFGEYGGFRLAVSAVLDAQTWAIRSRAITVYQSALECRQYYNFGRHEKVSRCLRP